MMDSNVASTVDRPSYVTALETIFGPPSQAGFGSAVFYEPLAANAALAETALARYKFFVGPLWERFGEAAWLTPWQAVYTRQPGAQRDLAAELQALPDRALALTAAMLLENAEDEAAARVALSAAYDDPAVTELVIYRIGDGAAMSGVLIAGRRSPAGSTAGDAVFLLLLLD